MIEINGDRMLSLLNDAVVLKGHDHIVSKCYYASWGSPHCIVGVALHLAGVNVTEVFSNEDLNTCRFGVAKLMVALGNHGFTFTKSAINMAGWAQYEQDFGSTWGHSVAFAYLRSVGVTEGGAKDILRGRDDV